MSKSTYYCHGRGCFQKLQLETQGVINCGDVEKAGWHMNAGDGENLFLLCSECAMKARNYAGLLATLCGTEHVSLRSLLRDCPH